MNTADRFTGRIFRRMWGPAIISSVGWALSDIADAVVVGQRMGTVGLAAIALILPVYMINCMFAHGLGIGGSVRYSRLLGEGKPHEAADSFNLVLQGALGCSLMTAVLGNIFMTPLLAVLGTVPGDGALFEAAGSYLRVLITATPFFYLSNIFNYYLRNDDNEKRAGFGSVAGNLTDIGLNIFFVLVLGLGTAGAALSTMIGQIVAVSVYLPGILGKEHFLQVKRAAPAPGYVLQTFSEGFSSSAQYLWQLIFLLLCNNVLIRAGSQASVAVFDMLQNASYLILYLYEGTARAMQPLVSTYCGEHREAGMRGARRYAFGFGGVGLMSALFIYIFPQAICSLFGIRDSSAVEMGTMALRLYCISTVPAGASILLAGYYQSCGQEKESLLIAALRGGIVLLPCTLICSWMGMETFWWLFPVTELLSLGLWSALRRMRGGQPLPFDGTRVFCRTVERGYGDMERRCGDMAQAWGDMARVTGAAEAFCGQWGASPRQTYYVTMTIEELCIAILQGSGTDRVWIEITLTAEIQGEFILHIRDTALSFNPFALETDKASEDGGFDMDAMGIRVIKSKAKEFFYRRYGGFNSLVVKI